MFNKKRIKVILNKYLKGKEPKLTDMQSKSISVFRKMVNNPNSTLLVDPLTNCCYVELNHYFIKLSVTSLLIKNTTFSNYCEIDYRIGEKLINFFFKHVSERRIKMESVYDGNTLKNLDEILKKILD
jgi:hypothetical protein